MPRGDGTGPTGTGPMGRGRASGQCSVSGRQGAGTKAMNSNSTNQVSLEEQATKLEEKAATLRKLAKQNANNA